MKFKKIYLFLLLIMFLGICGYCSQFHGDKKLVDEVDQGEPPTVGVDAHIDPPPSGDDDVGYVENLIEDNGKVEVQTEKVEDTNIDENENEKTEVTLDVTLDMEDVEVEEVPKTNIYIPFFSGSGSSSTSSSTGNVEYTDKTKDQLGAMMNEAVAQSMMTISMNANPVFTDGTGNVLIVNDAKNNYPQIVEIHTTSGILIYQSGVIPVGNKVETATLQATLTKGDHNCIATFNAINPATGERVAQAKAQILVTIK